jgi:hypothetical protein
MIKASHQKEKKEEIHKKVPAYWLLKHQEEW